MSEVKDIKPKLDKSSESEKPAARISNEDTVFPPFPEPDDALDFDDDVSDLEKSHYKQKFPDVRTVATQRLHCTACDRHLGCAARNDTRMKVHPMLRTLICQTCHTFYNSGEFDKGDDGSELYCRWCGQGGQVYCCSDCPHVFCAKCVKRNLGLPKIKEIENAEDWKCFKCNPNCLWDLRAICWALLRYCDLKNKITHKTEDPRLKEEFVRDCAVDYSECCKSKKRNVKKQEKKEQENPAKKNMSPANIISKIPSTIQVKKFASVFVDEQKAEKKGIKRPLDKPNSNTIKAPIPIAPMSKMWSYNPGLANPKKMKLPNHSIMNNMSPLRAVDRSATIRSYQPPPRFSPRPFLPMPMLTFNGLANSYNNMMSSDNINLSLDNLTQGLDMAAVQAINSNNQDDDLVCTPDLPPLEPLCEVTEDNNTDDDVQCITPAPAPAKVPKTPRSQQVRNSLPDLSSDNIIQMTENDVTVNKLTGGLKFRVDPQTLSSNKMYRLPDGRVFAITANPNMPAGYSATIVAMTETNKIGVKGATYNAKVILPKANSQTPRKRVNVSKKNNANVKKVTNTSNRTCDLDVPIEWFRYNLVDAIDALEYSQTRLNKLKKEANTTFLRTRTLEEMKKLHKRLENLLNTSITRFTEIKGHLNNELKSYVHKKAGNFTSDDDVDDDDDDVEILPNNDDPISIDENSMDSVSNETQDVDLTANSTTNNISDTTVEKDHNEQAEESALNESTTIINSSKSSNDTDKDLETNDKEIEAEETNVESNKSVVNGDDEKSGEHEKSDELEKSGEVEKSGEHDESINEDDANEKSTPEEKDLDSNETVKYKEEKVSQENDEKDDNSKDSDEKQLETEIATDKPMKVDEENSTSKDKVDQNEKMQDTEMSDDLIADLLKDDTCDDTVASNTNSAEVADLEET